MRLDILVKLYSSDLLLSATVVIINSARTIDLLEVNTLRGRRKFI